MAQNSSMLLAIETDFGTEALPQSDGRGEMLLAISNAVVHLYKTYFGRGPTKARAYHQGDVITCVLRDGYTRAERTLIESGRVDAVLSQRQALQQAVRHEFTSAVEQITGRDVIGFFSGSQQDTDMSVEVFVLAPMNGAA